MTSPGDLAADVARRLAAVDNVVAVVLGGSLARGESDAQSDVDLGIYYDPAHPPALAALRALAQELDDRHPANAVTDFGGWGQWINGGGWLDVDGRRVDWLYRDIAKVSSIIGECRAGRYGSYYQPGHPHAFHTHMYVGEVHHGRALADRAGRFAALQARTTPYPPPLRETVVRRNLGEAKFALENAAKAPARGDVFYLTGCLFRSAACLVQVLFALNNRYFLNEKRSVETAGTFAVCPEGFAHTVSDVFASPGGSPEALRSHLQRMEELVESTRSLCAANLS